ncbi:Methyltransferase type 12 [Xylanimonas cellulosilytica DSM 15894]|uniref:Methyltransferase type 12 n=1 Tax=Xylanimonas cellulosilytica (strain DSM 15894 / JCM 12276 / CECT 5975 / KCTC 9989 / LMG 20990 / NBRC 107835 / XIL07) TaxID=446471 RepID=D1C039_XYLCX|nr:class I SAM-dependent methyltransferase [Xylanimonas cellulosilytica]ACZ30228.1 Methyltransferase type 12 [Xylanimonas cellulosilytica DSM 15894]
MTAFTDIVRGTSRRPHHVVIRALARGFDALNRSVRWSHNDHFHGWVLRRLRAARGPAVVDVGCGRGGLVAALRSRGTGSVVGTSSDVRTGSVVGIDPDEVMARAAADRFAADDGVTIARTSFFDLARGDGLVPEGGAGGITMIASLHHLAHERGLESALSHARGLLAPGGRLLVVGLARPSVPADYAVDAVSVLLNPLMGLAKSLTRRGAAVATDAGAVEVGAVEVGADEAEPAGPSGAEPDGSREDGMPVCNPAETFTEVAQAAAAVLPGARVRRRLWFRYSLEWTAA